MLKMMRFVILAAVLTPLLAAQFNLFGRKPSFIPANRLSGIGVDRPEMSDTLLARRTELMMESQTFGILRDPRSLEGAARVTGPRLKKIFQAAAQSSGLPASFLAAIAYLESWGIADAQSPAGPKGIMQFAAATARASGLKIVYATRYRTATVQRKVKNRKGKLVTQKVKRKIPYTVLVRDERLIPEKAVPAAAAYLARMEENYGGRDWAVFAYHCGEGCAAEVRSIVERSDGMKAPVSVARAFFSSNPAYNRDLYQTMRHHMERDFSPTYFFRISRAEQLLSLYERDPAQFRKIYDEYRNRMNPDQRAPHRLAVWLTPEDLAFRTCEDLKREQGGKLVRAFDDANFFGFSLRRTGLGAIGEADLANQEYYLQASPSVIGTIAYVAFETRRLHEAMKPRGEKWEPLEITALVQPLDYEERLAGNHGRGKAEPAHCTGQVFDLNYAGLPPGQREALEFVLNDLGWDGYLGFVRDQSSTSTFHVGASPTARDFFARIYEEALTFTKATD